MPGIWNQRPQQDPFADFPDAQQSDPFAAFPDAGPSGMEGQFQPGAARYGTLAAKTAGNIGADVVAAPADLLALAAKTGVAAVDLARTGMWGEQPWPWEEGAWNQAIPFAPASTAIKDLANTGIGAVGDMTGIDAISKFAATTPSTPLERGIATGAEIAGSIIGGGALAKTAAAVPESAGTLGKIVQGAYGSAVPSIPLSLGKEIPENVPIIGGKVLATPAIGDLTAPYKIAAERAASGGSVPLLQSPFARDIAAGAGAGLVAGIGENDGWDNPFLSFAGPVAGGMAGAGALGALSGGAKGALGALDQSARQPSSEFGGAKPSVVDDLARAMQDQARLGGMDPSQAAYNILSEAVAQRAAGLTPNTSMTLSNNQGLIGLETASALDPRNSPWYKNHYDALQQGYDNTLGTQFGPEMPASADEAVQFAQRDASAKTAAANQAVSQAEAEQLAAKQALDAENRAVLQSGVAPSGSAKTDAAINVAKAEKQARETQFEGPRQERYAAALDAGAKVSVDPAQLSQIGTELQRDFGPLAANNGALGSVLGRLQDLTPGTQVSGRDLMAVQKELSAAVDAARADNNGYLVDRLVSVKTIITDKIDQLAAQDKAFGDARAKAEQFFQEGAPTYRGTQERKTAAGALRSAEQSQSAPQLSEVPQTYLQNREGAQNLSDILRNDPNARGNVGQYLAQDMVDTVASDGTISPAKLDAYVRKNADILAQFPEARKQIYDIRARIVNKSDKVSQLEQDVLKARSAKDATDLELNQGAFRLFAGKDPSQMVASILEGSTDPRENMKQAVELLSKDPDGRAMLGFKQALLDRVYTRTTGKTKLQSGDRATSQTRTFSNLPQYQQEALAQVYTPEQMNAVRAAEKQIEIAARKAVRATTGSDTSEKLEAAKALGSLAIRTGFNGLQGGMIIKNVQLFKTFMENLPFVPTKAKQERAISELFMKAQQDPELAYKLLNRPVDVEKIPAWNSALLRAVGVGEAARDEAKDD